jgi:hypothetical protein
MLCRRHHRAVHEENYHEREPDRRLTFQLPNGWLLPAVPVPAAVPADPVGDLRAENGALGLRIDARTSMPSWLGDRLDVGYAIDVLHPRAIGGDDHTTQMAS